MPHTLAATTPRVRSIACLLLAMLAFLAAVPAARAQGPEPAIANITTTDDNTYVGRVITDEKDTMRIMTSDSVLMAIPRTRIRSIEYGTGSTGRRDYWVFGGALGTPAGVNVVIGHHWGGWGVRGSGMYWGSLTGFQVDAVKIFRTSNSFAHQLFLGVGTLHIGTGVFAEPEDWTYVAFGYGMNAGGFHLAAGFSVGTGNFSNPQLMLQLGYVHEFK